MIATGAEQELMALGLRAMRPCPLISLDDKMFAKRAVQVSRVQMRLILWPEVDGLHVITEFLCILYHLTEHSGYPHSSEYFEWFEFLLFTMSVST
jgi:hypothetical protein